MNRLLLTFLALLAGLLAQGTPAQAREIAAGASQIGVVEVPMAQIGAAAQVQVDRGTFARREVPEEIGLFGKALALAIQAPTVQLGIDRARE